MKRVLAAGLVLGLAACVGGPGKKSETPAAVGKATAAHPATSGPRGKSPYPPAQEDLSKRGHYQAGGLYAAHIKDSAPVIDIDVSLIPEPEVVAETRSAYGNRPNYVVLGKNYRVMDDTTGFVERGTASYYGNKFHGRRTSNMEIYDIYAFTAAHKSLPLPSYARVTNLDNGQSVVVRVNDRGPFHDGRVVDLSYAAAVKLGIDRAGTGRVEVEALQPGPQAPRLASTSDVSPAAGAAAPPASTSLDTLLSTLPAGVADTAVAIKAQPRARTSNRKVKASGAVGATSVAATATPVVAVSTATAGEAAENWRFDMSRDGRTMTADEFDAWMVERKIRVSNGRFYSLIDDPAGAGAGAGAPVPVVAASGTAKALAQPSAPSATAAVRPVVVTNVPVPVTSASGVVLQVASFSARDNADRALAMLRGAGIDGANIHDGTANGQRVWRLRVGPLESAAASGLASRIVGLGFGQPHRVTE